MTLAFSSDMSRRIDSVPSPLEWDVEFTRTGPDAWDASVSLAAERDPDPTILEEPVATATVHATAPGDAHRFNVRGSETMIWLGGDHRMEALAHHLIDEVITRAR